MRLLLADDERQRYSAWYKDYGLTVAGGDELATAQQIPGISPSPVSQHRNQLNSMLASVIDLQIALITSVQTVSKPMQVRLTRRSHCSELRGYSSQGSLSSMAQSVPSYASPSASSSANPNAIGAIFYATSSTGFNGSLAIMIVSLLFSCTLLATERLRGAAPSLR